MPPIKEKKLKHLWAQKAIHSQLPAPHSRTAQPEDVPHQVPAITKQHTTWIHQPAITEATPGEEG